MSKDLVERLRTDYVTVEEAGRLFEDAASALTADRARIAELEGELEDAVYSSDKLNQELADWRLIANKQQDRAETAERGRDEALKQLAFKEPLQRQLDAVDERLAWAGTGHGRVSRVEELLAAERERDEARGSLSVVTDSHKWLMGEKARLERRLAAAERERDEARALLARYRKEISVTHLAVQTDALLAVLVGDQTGATEEKPDDRDCGNGSVLGSRAAVLLAPEPRVAPSPSEERYRQALTPSVETKAAYIGEFHFLQEAYSEEFGEEVTCRVTVPWTTIKEIMAAIRAFAALSPTQPEGGVYLSDAVFDGVREKDADAAQRHLERAKNARQKGGSHE